MENVGTKRGVERLGIARKGVAAFFEMGPEGMGERIRRELRKRVEALRERRVGGRPVVRQQPFVDVAVGHCRQ